ncbi:MAG TPA: hypothetical protein VK438_19815 [Xanthobacteraceae bacterium]|nr:hypothetical protein [Xanthobacteraceae bacterium]
MSVLRLLSGAALATAGVLLLAGCASEMAVNNGPQVAAAPSGAPLPASIPAQDLVGRWGLAAYHKDEDRARTETAARGQCRQPYNITRGPGGGVIMHLADQSQPTELMLKGGPDGKNYIGPAEDPAAGQRDREIVSFDGRVLITRFVDQEVAGRYGTSVYVRCGAETAPPKKKKKVAKAAAPKAPPPPQQQ